MLERSGEDFRAEGRDKVTLSAEERLLLDRIIERVTEIQDAVKRALPGNVDLQREFQVGEPAPQTPAQAVRLARAIEPLAQENRQLLIGRGVDGAKLKHLSAMAADLEKLSTAHPAPAPEAAAPKKGKQKRSS